MSVINFCAENRFPQILLHINCNCGLRCVLAFGKKFSFSLSHPCIRMTVNTSSRFDSFVYSFSCMPFVSHRQHCTPNAHLIHSHFFFSAHNPTSTHNKFIATNFDTTPNVISNMLLLLRCCCSCSILLEA